MRLYIYKCQPIDNNESQKVWLEARDLERELAIRGKTVYELAEHVHQAIEIVTSRKKEITFLALLPIGIKFEVPDPYVSITIHL